jgi:tetratricopeptide (TPR) repeat protein
MSHNQNDRKYNQYMEQLQMTLQRLEDDLPSKKGLTEDDIEKYKCIAECYTTLENPDKAKESFEKALKIHRSVRGDDEETSTSASIYSQLASIEFHKFKDFEKSKWLLNEALYVYSNLGDISDTISTLVSIGYICRRKKLYELSNYAFQQALFMAEKIAIAPNEMSNLLLNLITVSGKLNKQTQVLEYTNKLVT